MPPLLWYKINANGNIIKVTLSTGGECRYKYDDMGQLLREDNTILGKTYVYEYDKAGNITKKYTYALTAKNVTPTNPESTYIYGYGDTNWGDKLTAYRGESITYDEIGNPLSYYNGKRYTFTWENGRRLATATVDGVTLTFTYNDEGIRTSKPVGGSEHIYHLNGTQIIMETWAQGHSDMIYLYDAEGSPIGMKYRGGNMAVGEFEEYWFEKNLQGDIVAVYDAAGNKHISYTYDAWGNFSTTYYDAYSTTSHANLNPFRYRGYYYDSETGLYYLQSRYYDPVIGRFISADKQMPSVGGDILGYNMFAYCFNNPVNLSDTMGNWPRWVEAAAVAVSAAVLVAAVVATVAAVSAFTAGTGTPAAVYGATVLLGASLAGINGAVANTSEGDSYLNGYVGGFIGGGTQAAASILSGGNIWGGALGAGKGTAITMTLDNIDPDSSNSTFAEIAGNAASSFIKGGAMGAFTQFWSSAVGGINYFRGVVEGAVADGASGLMPTLTLGFGEGIKAFFGWLDDAMVYIWE